jgi:predicted PurR-regulated permease PerM
MNRTLASGPIVWLGIIVTTCLLLVLFQTALWLVMPVLLAVVAYYMLSPLVAIGMSKGLSRARAVFMVTVLLTLFLVAVGIIVYPKVIQAANNWQAKGGEYADSGVRLAANAQTSLSKFLPFMRRAAPNPDLPDDKTVHPHTHRYRAQATIPDLSTNAAPTDDARETDAAAAALNDKVADLTNQYSGDIALQVLHWVPSLLLIPYLTYFFLLDGSRFKRFLISAIPNAFFEKTLYLFYRVEDQIRRYFQGLLALTMLDGVCLGIGLWFLGIGSPFFLAAVAAVMAWLPYLGSIGGCVLVVLKAAHDFPTHFWLPYEVVGLFIGVRLLDDFLFMPLTVGRSLHMHPLVTVLMILLGGAVAGVSGLLLVLPVLGVVMVAGQIIGELLMDERILARHRHAKALRRLRAKAGLKAELK